MSSPLGIRRREPAQPRVNASFGSDIRVILIANLFGFAVALLVTVIGARTLSVVDFGRLSWMLTTVYLIGAVGACGTPLSVVAHRGAAADTAAADSFDRASLRLTVFAGAALAAGLALIAQVAPHVVGRDLASVAPFAGVVGAVTAMIIAVSAVLRSRRRFVLSVILGEHLLRTGTLVGIVVAWLAGRATAEFVAITLTAWAVCIALGLGAWVYRAWPAPTPATPLRDVAKRTLPFFVGSIGTILIPQAGVWTLGARTGPEDVAILSVAIRISMICSLVAVAVNRSLGPRITSHQHDVAALTATSRGSATVTFLLTAALASPVIIGGPWLIALVFGEQFRAAWAPTVMLLGGLLVSTAAGPCGLVLYHSGYERLVASRVFVAGVGFVVATATTASRTGAVGVAAIAAATVTVLNLWQVRTARRLTSVTTWAHVQPSAIRSSFRSLTRQGSSQKVHG